MTDLMRGHQDGCLSAGYVAVEVCPTCRVDAAMAKPTVSITSGLLGEVLDTLEKAHTYLAGKDQMVAARECREVRESELTKKVGRAYMELGAVALAQ